ncbi:MAG: hypothetical protein EHM18_05045 [Acidobacteria bacterium]|nr:MAG: hypothetical protein EHM18_05045 [Acidobacteriota bacterium]
MVLLPQRGQIFEPLARLGSGRLPELRKVFQARRGLKRELLLTSGILRLVRLDLRLGTAGGEVCPLLGLVDFRKKFPEAIGVVARFAEKRGLGQILGLAGCAVSREAVEIRVAVWAMKGAQSESPQNNSTKEARSV